MGRVPFPGVDEVECSRVLGGRLVVVERGFPKSDSRSNGSGSCIGEDEGRCGSKGGLEAGDTSGDVCMLSGIAAVVSKTKKASPPSPSFM